MIIQAKTVLKEFFETGDKPTQQQYWSLIDSLRHVHDKIPLIDLQEDVVSQVEFQSHLDSATFNGDVTAVNFIGNGSQLTGITLDNLPNNVAYTNLDNNFSVAQSISESSDSLKGLVITNTNSGSEAAATIRLISDGGSGYIYKTSNAFGLGLADRLGIQNAEGIQFVTGSTLVRYEIESNGNHDFQSGSAAFGGLITGTEGMTLGGSANSTTRNPQYLVFGGAAGSEYGMELGYDSTRAKYSTRIITSSSQDISFGAMNSPATNHSDFTEYFVIQNGGNFDFKSGQATFGGLLTANNGITANGISKFSNIASNWIKIDGGVNGTNDAAIYARGNTLRIQNDNSNFGSGDISIEADGNTYITSDLHTSILVAGNSTDFRIKNQAGSSIAIFNNDLSTTFASNITAPNLLGNVIGAQFTASSASGVQIRNNAGQPIATFSDTLNTSFKGDISLESDTFLYLGDSNNARLFVNSTDTFFDGLTGNMYFRNQSDGGRMYFQVEDSAGADLNLIQINGDTQDVYLRYQSNIVAQTSSTGLNVNGDVRLTEGDVRIPDSRSLFIGDSTDLRMYHTSDNSFIDNITGHLYVRNRHNGSHLLIQTEDDSGNPQTGIYLKGSEGTVELAYQNSKRLETTSDGITLSGVTSVIKSGLATPHADTDLFVSDSTAALSAAQIQILGGNNGLSNLYFSDIDNYAVGGAKYAHSTDTMTLRAGGVDVMNITSSGATLTQSGAEYTLELVSDANRKNLLLSGTGESLIKFGSSSYNSGNGAEIYQTSTGDLFFNLNSTTNTFLIDSANNKTFFQGAVQSAGTITSTTGFSTGIEAANTGSIRLENEDTITSRNSANSGNRTLLYLDASNVAQFSEGTDSVFGGTITIGDTSLAGHHRLNYQKDANNSNGWYVGYLNGSNSNNDFGIYGYENNSDFEIHTNNALGLRINSSQDSSFSGEIIAAGTITSNAGFSTGAQAANAGSIRLENQDKITSRNSDNSDNKTLLYLDASNIAQFSEGIDSVFGGKVNIYRGSAGAVAASSLADSLVLESSASTGLSIFTPDANSSQIHFGSNSRDLGARITWNHDSDEFTFGTAKSGSSTIIKSGNEVTAITIDSSQNVETTGILSSRGTMEIYDDGGSNYTHSRIILNSDNNNRGTGMFTRGATHDWYWGNPYSEHDKAFIIARAATGTNDAVAQYSNALFTLSETGIKIPTSIEIARSGWNTYSIQQSAGNGLQFYDVTADNSTMYLIDDKVGINNTAPTAALDVTGEAKATSFTQTGADVYTTISQLNTSTSRFYADANLQIEAGTSANLLFLTNGAERARIDLNGLMTLKNGLTVIGTASATNFIGNWNGKTNADYVSISGDETISGLKTFTNDVDIVYDKVKFYADPIPEGNPGSGFSTNLEGTITASYGEGLVMDSDLKVTGNLLAEGNINTDGGLGVDTNLNVGGDAFISQNISAGSYSVALSSPPSSASSTGAAGDIKYSTDHIYVCVATDTWKRVALATW